MFDEPQENPEGESDSEKRPFDPAERAKAKSDEFRMHAELAAIFEAVRKFEVELDVALDAQIARDVQKRVAKLEKSRAGETPLIPPESMELAAELLELPKTKGLSTNDYHIHRRPGETMIVRWLEGERIDTFYERLQAHFDSALNQYREDQRSSLEWKQDEKATAYLAALDEIKVKMEDRYLRPLIRKHGLYILSTQSADEMDILHLCDYIMGVPAAHVVGEKSAPPVVDASESDRTWFFKLFSLRGFKDGVERMMFFTYLQKTDDSADW